MNYQILAELICIMFPNNTLDEMRSVIEGHLKSAFENGRKSIYVGSAFNKIEEMELFLSQFGMMATDSAKEGIAKFILDIYLRGIDQGHADADRVENLKETELKAFEPDPKEITIHIGNFYSSSCRPKGMTNEEIAALRIEMEECAKNVKS